MEMNNMCGIAGWTDCERNLSQHGQIIEKMTRKLSSRGPDACSSWKSEHALIGHTRLIVIDPSGGIQPMIREHEGRKFVLVYNGELYNTADLRSVLKSLGHDFMTSSDTEVVLVSYMQWGAKCVERLNGIFAFGVWNDTDKTLFLARDRFGVKPLFYAARDNSVIFGSELKALLEHPYIEPRIDNEGLAEILSLAPSRTPGHGIFKGVSEVLPSGYLLYNMNGIHTGKYWRLCSSEHAEDYDTTVANVRGLVTDAIQRQLVSDVPLCTFLSGGLDSSAISAVASEHFRKTGTGPLHTYSVDYAGNENFFEESAFQPDADTPWVKKMSRKIKSRHHYIKIDTPELVKALEDAVYARDLPGMADVDSSLLLFCREVRREHTVALSGECADEIFGGYPWYYKQELLNTGTFPWMPADNIKTYILSDSATDMIKPESYAVKRYIQTLEEVPELPGENKAEARRRQMFYLNLNWFMATLLDRKDRMSMATGLEVRVPYCDHRLVQYVWNVPWEMKMYKGREKGLLRSALEGILPRKVLYRKKSPYPKTHNPAYEKAVSKWLNSVLEDSGSPILPLVNKEKLTEMMHAESDYGKPWFGQLMAAPQLFAFLIQLDIWMRKYSVVID